jgi:hypothetical protein
MGLSLPAFNCGHCQLFHAQYLVALTAFFGAFGDSVIVVTGENSGKGFSDSLPQIGMLISDAGASKKVKRNHAKRCGFFLGV